MGEAQTEENLEAETEENKETAMIETESETEESSETETGSWRHCSGENGNCGCRGRVRYGERGRFSYRNSNGNIGCNNRVFGDPIRGVRKNCWCEARQVSNGNWRHCSGENCGCRGRV